MTEEELTKSAREHFEERAGILEFEAGLPRDESERIAMEEAARLMSQ